MGGGIGQEGSCHVLFLPGGTAPATPPAVVLAYNIAGNLSMMNPQGLQPSLQKSVVLAMPGQA